MTNLQKLYHFICNLPVDTAIHDRSYERGFGRISWERVGFRNALTVQINYTPVGENILSIRILNGNFERYLPVENDQNIFPVKGLLRNVIHRTENDDIYSHLAQYVPSAEQSAWAEMLHSITYDNVASVTTNKSGAESIVTLNWRLPTSQIFSVEIVRTLYTNYFNKGTITYYSGVKDELNTDDLLKSLPSDLPYHLETYLKSLK